MKKLLLSLAAALLIFSASAQVASNCTVPPILSTEYFRDLRLLAINRMMYYNSPDTALVRIPQPWVDSIAGGMAAIFNATSIPERDSVFNLYCVHNITGDPGEYAGWMVNVDTNYAWTQAWQNLQSMTGNPFIDTVMSRYDLQVTQFYNWSFGSFAILTSDSMWNHFALADTLEMEPGVGYVDIDALIGGAGRIDYNTLGNEKYYDFYFQFSDCFDGCDNWHRWSFKVNPNCSVDYLGFADFGFFGVQPLPAPVNCNISTSLASVGANEFKVYPNPVRNIATITSATKGTGNVMLTDVSGRVIKSLENVDLSSFTLDLSAIAAGSYIYKIYTEHKLLTAGKVVKE